MSRAGRNWNRRRFLLGAAGVMVIGAGVGGTLAVRRGIRYPILQLEPDVMATRVSGTVGELVAQGAFVKPRVETGSGEEVTPGVIEAHMRAFVPQPIIDINAATPSSALTLRLDNIHPGAVLETDAQGGQHGVDEQATGLSRTIRLSFGSGSQHVRLRYRVPFSEQYTFAAIGDTGGGLELRWCLERAANAGADFVFHLGDLFYHDSDILLAPAAIDESRVPVYTSIGNHDFNRGLRRLHRDFSSALGPRNSSFELGGTRFVNIDTAAGTQPVSGGDRGRLLAALGERIAETESTAHNVVVTHKPLYDPRQRFAEKYSHDVSSAEADWLHRRLLELDTKAYIAGHIHYKDEHLDNGLMTYVSGDGLGRRDFIDRYPVSQMLMGKVADMQAPAFSWLLLNMPLNRHCHPDTLPWLKAHGLDDYANRQQTECAASLEVISSL